MTLIFSAGYSLHVILIVANSTYRAATVTRFWRLLMRHHSATRLAGILLFLIFTTACKPEVTATPSNASPTDRPALPLLQQQTVPYGVEPYAIGIAFPTRMAWSPDGRLFVAEKNGAIRVVSADGELQTQPVIVFPVDAEGEQGLLGLAVDPDFENNHYLWAFYTYLDPDAEERRPVHRVVRIVEENGTGSDEQIAWEVKDAFIESTILNGGEIGFGPDGMLYVSPGSHNNILTTVDPEKPQGKILRMTPTIPAEPAPDNPDPASFNWAYGFRNTFAFTFHPETGEMYGTENGPDCDDEINRILPGRDYGWRIDGLCEDGNLPDDYPSRFEPPVAYYTPTISPTGIMFYTGDQFPEWSSDLFFCAYNLGKMYRIRLLEDGVNVKGAGSVDTGRHRCAVAITTGPDGNIYFSDIEGIYRVVRTGLLPSDN
jgi:aldose sugar dehydrogenase